MGREEPASVSRRCAGQRGGHAGLERGALRSLRRAPGAFHSRSQQAHGDAAHSASSSRCRGTAPSTSAAASATPRSSSPRWSASRVHATGVDVAEPLRRGVDRRGPDSGIRKRRLLRDRCPGRGPEGALRLRLLADGRDVLRQPGAGAPQHRRLASAGRPAGRRRMAAQARQRVAPSRGAGGRAVPREARGARGRALWSRPFSMANPDTVSEQLQIAGFEWPTFTRRDIRSRSATTSTTRSTSTWLSVPPPNCFGSAPPTRSTGCARRSRRRSGESSPITSSPTALSAPRRRPGSSARPSRVLLRQRPWRALRAAHRAAGPRRP